jgi:hypothetical protein
MGGDYFCNKTYVAMKKVKKILISQPVPVSARNPYADIASEYGVECDFFQLI